MVQKTHCKESVLSVEAWIYTEFVVVGIFLAIAVCLEKILCITNHGKFTDSIRYPLDPLLRGKFVVGRIHLYDFVKFFLSQTWQSLGDK